MKRFCGLLLMIVQVIYAQKLEFSGYYENQLFPQEIKQKVKITDYNKLRINLVSKISSNVNFMADYVYRTFHGAVSFNTLDFIPEQIVNDYAEMAGIHPDSLRPMFDFEQKDENFLDNANVTLYMTHFNLRIGKQQLAWGAGYTWNPTDLFHDKNMIDPTYEKTGVNALNLEIPFSKEGTVTGVLSYEDDWEKTTKGIKIHEIISGIDLSASYVEKHQSVMDDYLPGEYWERRQMAGLSFSTQFLGLGVWGEGAYNRMQDSKNYGQYLIGFDYTFENGLYLSSELYRNELGKSNQNDYQFGDWVRLFSSQGENLGREYWFGGQSYPIMELLNWSNYLILNLNDGSFILFPWLDYNLNDNTELNLVGYLPVGKTNSEFGEFGAGGLARIRVYF